MNDEKTRIVEAEEGFEFLGFRFVRHYSRRKEKRVTRWFPSSKQVGEAHKGANKVPHGQIQSVYRHTLRRNDAYRHRSQRVGRILQA
jgi:hypothetical protein